MWRLGLHSGLAAPDRLDFHGPCKKTDFWKYLKTLGLENLPRYISENKGLRGKYLRTKDLSFVFCSPH